MSPSAYKFVEEPSQKLRCMTCLRVTKDHVQHKTCGSLFCKECCVENHGKGQPCRGCKQEQPAFFMDKKRGKVIRALDVKCTNMDTEGFCCDWKGTFGTLETHVAACKFPLAVCPLQCKDKKKGMPKMVPRITLSQHVKEDCPYREVSCEHCGRLSTCNGSSQVPFRACSRIHFQDPSVPVIFEFPMLKGCTHVVLFASHLDTCEHAIVQCKYKKIGCERRLERMDIAKHEEEADKGHLHLALDVIATLLDSNSEHIRGQTQLAEAISKLDFRVQAAMANISLQKKSNREKMEATLCKISDRVLSTAMLDSEFYKMEETVNHVLTFKITDCQRVKEDGAVFSSPTFYTKQGYHFMIKVLLDGGSDETLTSGGNRAVVLLVSALPGERDDSLSWPFVGGIVVALSNQFGDSHHYRETLEIKAEYNIRPGTGSNERAFSFISFEELYEYPDPFLVKKYLVDDTLYFQVSIKMPKPWLVCT